jgi:phenylpyruvate tautomerase PptA (4-oxalocrotonate tautomerase family)
MRMEVHVHGNIFLGRGVRLSQVEHALRPWLEYLDVDTIAEAHSLEREEPGIQFDARERTVNLCWTGEVGRNFHARLEEAFQSLGPLTEYASEIEVTYYPENGEDEFCQMFVGPTVEAIHEFRRQCVIEDVATLLGRHLGKSDVDQVTVLVNQLFDQDWAARKARGEPASTSSTVIPLHPRNKHLH